jgi:hypothetical protein
MTDMEKVAKIFNAFSQADESDSRYYNSPTPAQRPDILFTLIARRNATQIDEASLGFGTDYRIIKRA